MHILLFSHHLSYELDKEEADASCTTRDDQRVSDVDEDGDEAWLMADEASLAPAAYTVLQYYHYNYMLH